MQLVLANSASEEDWIGAFYDRSKKKIVVYHSLFDLEEQNNRVRATETWHISVDPGMGVEVKTLDVSMSNMWRMPSVIDKLETSRLLFYSPFLDMRNAPTMTGDAWDKITNVSQNRLIAEDIADRKYSSEDNVVERHKLQNVQRQFDFVQKHGNSAEHINLPDSVDIRFYKQSEIDTGDLGHLSRKFYEQFNKQMRAAMDIPNTKMSLARDDNNMKAFYEGLGIKVKYWFLRNLVNNFILNLERHTFLNDEKTKRIQIKDDLDPSAPEIFVKRFFKEQDLVPASKFDFSHYIDYVSELIFNPRALDPNEDNEAFFTVDIETAKKLLDLHHLYITAFPTQRERTGFMAVDWRNMSSGEKAYLDLFSRINYGLEQIRDKGLRKGSTIFVLIDEGDISFHPKWQKAYLKNLLAYFTANDQYKYQLLLTTHSPYLVSDLPHGNVLLLGKDLNSKIGNGKKKTFGANIHELLSDSFFMGETLFGDFAYDRINEVFQWAKGEVELESKYVLKVINLIDEPLLHYKLLQLYFKKTGENQQVGYLRSQIAALQIKLRQVEGGQGDTD